MRSRSQSSSTRSNISYTTPPLHHGILVDAPAPNIRGPLLASSQRWRSPCLQRDRSAATTAHCEEERSESWRLSVEQKSTLRRDASGSSSFASSSLYSSKDDCAIIKCGILASRNLLDGASSSPKDDEKRRMIRGGSVAGWFGSSWCLDSWGVGCRGLLPQPL